jgi:hypothetical protein
METDGNIVRASAQQVQAMVDRGESQTGRGWEGRVETGIGRDEARRAAAGLRQASRGATLGGIRIKDLVNESRP